jgi:hypothetical protein
MVVNRGTDDSVGADGKIWLLKGSITIYALIKVIPSDARKHFPS